MPNRREFLETGAVALAVSGFATGEAAAVGAARPHVRPYRALVDDRYVVTAGFVAALQAEQVPVRALDAGDVTRFWYDELDPLWRKVPVALAGMTQFGPMFVIARLAAERGLVQALEVEHRVGADGALLHVATGPREVVVWLEQAGAIGIEWPALMALAACRCEHADGARRTAVLRLAGDRPELSAAARAAGESSYIHYYTPRGVQQGYGAALDAPLYSWVMVPRARVET